MNWDLLIHDGYAYVLIILGIVFLFDLILRGIAMWKAAKKNQKIWFVALLFINSVGILPVIYLLVVDKKEKKKNNE